MECRPLDITLNSAKDLKDLNLFSKMDLYAVVSIHGDYFNNNTSQQKTHIDKDCGPNPKWNFPMKFTIDINAAEQNRLALVVKIKAEKKLAGDKEVGEVHVPIKELLESYGEESKDERRASYSVRTPSGKAKGVLDFTYKFGEKFTATQQKAKNADTDTPVTAYPVGYGAAGPSGGPAPAYPPPGMLAAGTVAAAYPYAHQPPPHGGYPPQGGYPPPPMYGGYPPQPAYNGGYPQYPHQPPFRALECLSFQNMPEWQEWVIFEWEVFSCLQKLYINDCPKLSGCLPVQLPSLTKLDICECEQLVASLPNSPALHELLCTGKIQIPSGYDCRSLRSVRIEGSGDSILSFLPEFASLFRLEFCGCPDLVSFPSGGLCAPNLSQIVIANCRKLKSLPEGMHAHLSSLVSLQLQRCPELESFPEGGLPSSLESLVIHKCEKLISRRMELGLQGLHSLRSFTISRNDNELESFPEEGLLPPNLTDFTIGDLPDLKSLNGKGFQPLTSLKNLSIWSCNNLDCLLEDVLPTSLCELHIYDCPLLKERYGNEKGEGRVKIAHIPRISIS